MYKYIMQKTITSIIALFVVFVMTYFLYVTFKGNPFESEAASLKPEEYDAKLKAFGIDKSPGERFISYLTGLFSGDWGRVYTVKSSQESIPEMFFKPLKTSMLVAIPSYFLGMILGFALGFLAGYKHGTWVDVVINWFTTLFIAIPSFILAVFAIIVGPFLNLPINFQDSTLPGVDSSLMIRSLILPIVVMTIVSLAGWTNSTRIEVSKILKSDYILAARTRGFSELQILFKYVFRNAMYPYVGSLVTSFMIVFSSSLVVERFFNVNGTTQMLLNASQRGEINIIIFQLLFFGFIGLGSQIIVDVAQFSINPIVRSHFSSKVSPFVKVSRFLSRKKEIQGMGVMSDKAR